MHEIHFPLAGVVDDSMVVQRPRESTYPLISVDEALQIVMAEADVMDMENLRLTGWIFIFCYHLRIFQYV